MRVEDAVKVLVDTVNLPHFQTTPESQRILDDLCLSAQIQASLVQEFPEVKVGCVDGEAHVSVVAPLALAAPISAEQKTIARIKSQIMNLPGVKKVSVNVVPPISAE
jgi:hypothetical protein